MSAETIWYSINGRQWVVVLLLLLVYGWMQNSGGILLGDAAIPWSDPAHREDTAPKPGTQPTHVFSRIVGGQSAASHQFPFFASLTISASSHCGAAFIAPNYVLTAAHCIEPPSYVLIPYTYIRYNSNMYGEGSMIKVKHLVQHPEYNPSTQQFDFAIMELEESAKEDEIDIVDLYDQSASLIGRVGTVMGFGSTNGDAHHIPEQLQYVHLDILSDVDCYKITTVTNFTSMLCAGGRPGKSSCIGDGGGPLVLQGTKTIVGIVSEGIGCGGDSQYPGSIYSRISAAVPWIEYILDTGIEDTGASRCSPCTTSNACSGILTCFGGFCEWPSDPSGICESYCCVHKLCDCSDGDVCVLHNGDECTNTCQCRFDSVCENGRCISPSGTGSGDSERCEECQEDRDCVGDLGCYDEVCESSEDALGICESPCCVSKGCDCNDESTCVLEETERCSSDCQCLDMLRCMNGVCTDMDIGGDPNGLRCKPCEFSSQCAGSLECSSDEKCVLSFDIHGVCDSPCCKSCGCSDATHCIGVANSTCSESCQCIDDLECIQGVCRDLHPGSSRPRCALCSSTDPCDEGLDCYHGTCELPSDYFQICSGPCCGLCDCHNNNFCTKIIGSSCNNTCECDNLSACVNGTCVDTQTKGSKTPRCSPCTSNADCNWGYDLECIEGVCIWLDESPEICSSACCEEKDCSLVKVCRKSTNESCIESTECIDTSLGCYNKWCQVVPMSEFTATPTPADTTLLASPTAQDCFPSEGLVVGVGGMTLRIRDLRRGDLVFDGLDYTKVVYILDLNRPVSKMVYDSKGHALATLSHFGLLDRVSGSPDRFVGSHAHVFVLYTKSRYIQVHGVRISNYVSMYPWWIQELGICILEGAPNSLIQWVGRIRVHPWWRGWQSFWVGAGNVLARFRSFIADSYWMYIETQLMNYIRTQIPRALGWMDEIVVPICARAKRVDSAL